MKYISRSIIILFTSLLPHIAAAAIYCQLNQDLTNATASIQGVPTISITPDLPVGQVLYQGRFYAPYTGGDNSISCSRESSDTGNVKLKMRVQPRVEGESGLDDHTFKTNIPGIGVRFWIMGGYITVTDGNSPTEISIADVKPGWENDTVGMSTTSRQMTFFLVKTGDVKPGSLDGISFPSVKYTWIDNGSTEKPVGIPLTYVNFKFSGLLNVTVPSCTTPGDFSVSLGSYDISVLKKDGTTPWKNVGLKLTNCPAFSGYNGGTDTVWNITQPGDSTVVSGPSDGFRSNTLGVTLNPISGIIDAAKGTFNIDNSVTHSASGVALQLASGSTASQVPVNLGTRSEIVLSRTESPSSIDIPLVARIVKTTDNPTPGNVISKVTYLIDYK